METFLQVAFTGLLTFSAVFVAAKLAVMDYLEEDVRELRRAVDKLEVAINKSIR